MQQLPLLLLLAMCAAAAGQVIPPEQLFHRVSLSSAHPLAVCNDGEGAAMFYRNCSANWDRKPGDPDYCALPVTRWVVAFAGSDMDYFGGVGVSARSPRVQESGAYCYDAASCTKRATNLTTSRNLPDTAFPGGIALPYAEANPNLYKSHHVVVPYCSSDLWAGNSTAIFASTLWHFRGAAIIQAVVEMLFTLDGGGAKGGLAGADEVLLVGPAGLMARAADIAQYITLRKREITGNATAAISISALCDGCAIFDLPPPAQSAQECTSDANCPPSRALPLAQTLWGTPSLPWCAEAPETAWRCLTADLLLKGLLASSALPVLVQAQRFDAVQLAAYGAWPPTAANHTAARRWAEGVFGPAVQALLAGVRGATATVFGAACSSPSALALDTSFYHIMTPCTSTQGYNFTDALSQAVPFFFVDGPGSPMGLLRCEDTCTTMSCSSCGADAGVRDW
jgi:hypothetical protein